jgi:hypothetical protein
MYFMSADSVRIRPCNTLHSHNAGWRARNSGEEVSAITRVLDLGPVEVSSCGVDFAFVQIHLYAVEA